jgi:hypothetical protein
LVLADREFEVAEEFDNVLSCIAHAESQGPNVGGRRVLPAGWMIVHAVEYAQDVYLQTSAIAFVRKS